MMPSVTNHIVTQLRQLIYYNLDCNLLRNALFLAGRLIASEPKSPEATYLQALCQIRSGQYRAAYEGSKSIGLRGTHLGCSYVFAQSCLELGKHHEGLTALDRSNGLWRARNNWNKHTDSRRQHLPDASAVYCLVGKLCQLQKDPTQAIDSYAEALKLNPFMWDAFLGLCDLGVNVRTNQIFKINPEMANSLTTGSTEETPLDLQQDSPPNDSLSHMPQSSFSNDPFSVSANRANIDNRSNLSKSTLFDKLNGNTSTLASFAGGGKLNFEGPDTPAVPGVISTETKFRDPTIKVSEEITTTEPPQAPLRKSRTVYGGLGMEFGIDAPPKIKASSWKMKSKIHGEPEDADHTTANIPLTLSNGISERKRTVSGHVTQGAPTGLAIQSVHEPQRRSARLFNQIRPHSGKFSSSTNSIGVKDGKELKKVKATGTKGRTTTGSTTGRVVSSNRKHGDPMDIDGKEPRINGPSIVHPKPAVTDRAKELEALQWLLDLFVKLGSGYFALSHYRCEDAVQVFNAIIPSQRDTPWVLAQIGRALFEQSLYSEAERCFARIKLMAPARLEDMELYSTALWHLRRDVDLSHLAHEISDIDRLSPQAWCAIGNSFSLQREHDQALKCFKRATQLDPKFSYAFTLQGHEHQSNEEFDKALTAYRSAITVDHRHYQGWYGLAQVYEKQGKFENAEQHYRNAASINPTSAVLISCIGTVLEKMNNLKGALTQYTLSVDLAPRAPFARFKKARVLMSLQEPDLALTDLEILKNIAPDEANVHFWLGKCYKVLRQKGKSIKHLTIAMNLDPKASHVIREEMEQYENDVDDSRQMP